MLQRSMIKVACAVSGGVDSSVSAWLLKRAGFKVVGVYMQNWDLLDETADERQCSTECDFEDARYVCNRIGIPFESVRFVREYWLRVFEQTLSTYQRGWTPNPDILCNKYVKFDSFAKYARDTLKVDLIATGHYARNALVNSDKFSPITLTGNCSLQTLSGSHIQLDAIKDDSIHRDDSVQPSITSKDADRAALLCSADLRKDQSFWLAQIDGSVLRSTLFPVGGLHKTEVKRIAEQIGLSRITAKRESVGLCFVGKRREFGNFLSGYVNDRRGTYCSLHNDSPLGEHKGVHRFTLGQRVVLPGIRTNDLLRAEQSMAGDGNAQDQEIAPYQKPTALYVGKLDAERNIVRIVCGTNHPALFTRNVTCVDPVWFVKPKEFPLRCYFRWQNKFKFQLCTVHRLSEPLQVDKSSLSSNQTTVRYRIELDRPLRAVSAGQYAVLYNHVQTLDTFECIGSMLIVDNEPNEYQLGNRQPIDWNVENVQIDDQEIVLR